MSFKIENTPMPRGCRIIEFPEAVDDRGALAFAEGAHQIPFQIERVFWIYGVPDGKTRGGHSHSESAEVVVPVSGGFTMMVDDGTRSIEVRMDSPRKGILIPPGVWCDLRDFAPGTVCVVFASHPYNASGYINDYSEYLTEQLSVVRYDESRMEEWNAFVKISKNGTFLFDRRYMDYHSDRFTDCSLMFYKHGRLIAMLPANWCSDEGTVQSHGGLTYGGLIVPADMIAVDALEVFSCAIDWMKRELGAHRWLYKPIPYIYSTLPAEEDLYALFRSGGTLKERGVSSVIDCTRRLPMRQSRKSGCVKALKAGVTVDAGNMTDDLEAFWNILAGILMEKHHKKPVHTVAELRLLHSRFPEQIRLHVAREGGNVVAGALIYDMGHVVHTQYLASSAEGKRDGALDLLLHNLITVVYADRSYFDFGVSTENGGGYLNEGLIFQKEGFGARSVVYDTYEMLF
ncbi:MAG: GNAT family N-acetyltransferase [Bacteroidaceae bacterium]|nr:GNAT family N-acetyltransferase [Bacteroidaceae bacterium]